MSADKKPDYAAGIRLPGDAPLIEEPTPADVELITGPPPGREIKWACWEVPFDDDTPVYVAEELQATKEADRYLGNHGTKYKEPPSWGWITLPQLPFLKGKPWDQCALNYVHSLRPSSIRVVKPRQGVTADSSVWRVTVYLEDDERTIKSTSQEVSVGGVGCHGGEGLRRYFAGDTPEPHRCFANLKAIKKIKLLDEAPPKDEEESTR